jgi:tRNA (uracil-5-)-methyltransferase TRM9
MDSKYAKYLLKKTREDYNLIAEEFSRTRQEGWEEMKFLFTDFLIPGEKVLDLGCGNGRWFTFFQEYKTDYIGVDSSKKIIKIAKKRYPKTRFQVANALDLPFPNSFFDKIYSIAVLHQIPSQDLRLQFLKEAKRVLKPEGLLILTVWKLHQKKELYLLLKYTILKLIGKSKIDFKDIFKPWGKKVQRYYHCFSKRELESLIKKVNFKVKEIGLVKNKKGNRQNIYLVAQKFHIKDR